MSEGPLPLTHKLLLVYPQPIEVLPSPITSPYFPYFPRIRLNSRYNDAPLKTYALLPPLHYYPI